MEAAQIRPAGLQRKIMISDTFALSTAGDYIAGYFPNGARILGISIVTTVALTDAANVLDIGIAINGDTIIDGYSHTHTSSAIGDIEDMWATRGTNAAVINIPVGTLIWLQSSGGSTAGAGFIVITYTDPNN